MIPDSELKAILVAADAAFPEGCAPPSLMGPLMQMGLFAGGDFSEAERLIELLDAAISKHPRDTDLLMAKASALCRMMQMKSGEDVIDHVLAIDRQHLDAKMRKDVWDDWPLLFEFPAWDPKGKSAVPLYQTELGEIGPAETKLVLARVGLRLEPVAVQSTDGVTFLNGIRADMCGMVQVKLTETPHGFVAAWYVLLEDDVAKPFVREAFLPASGGEPHPLKGPWLLRKLADCGFCHLVFTAGERVVYHRRVELPAEQLQALRRACDHSADKRTPFDLDRFQSAVKWYTDRSDFAQIRFPPTDAGAAPELGDQKRTSRKENVRETRGSRPKSRQASKKKNRKENVKEIPSARKRVAPVVASPIAGMDPNAGSGQGQVQKNKQKNPQPSMPAQAPSPVLAPCQYCKRSHVILHSGRPWCSLCGDWADQRPAAPRKGPIFRPSVSNDWTDHWRRTMRTFFRWSFSIIGVLLIAVGLLVGAVGGWTFMQAVNTSQDLNRIDTGRVGPLDDLHQTLVQKSEADREIGLVALGAGVVLVIGGFISCGVGNAIKD